MQLLQDTTQLRQLADAVNEAIAEEYNLFGFPDNVPVLSPGVVRVACRVFARQQAEDGRDELTHHVIRVNDLVTHKLTDVAATPVTDDDRGDPPPDTNGFVVRPDGTEQTPWDLRSPGEIDALEEARTIGEKMAHENIAKFAAAVNGGD